MNCCVAPALKLALAGEREIETVLFTAAATVSNVLALKPSADAVTVVVPAATAVSNPELLIVATVGSEDVHVTPLASVPVLPSL